MNTASRSFWKNRKVLVTGYEGFLGSHLTKTLIDAGAKIIGLDIKIRRKETILVKQDFAKITIIKGNVVNYKLICDILKRHKISIIFHLAAEAIVGRSQKNPLKTFETNIKGTWNILESSRRAKSIEAIVIASSDKAYGSHKKLPYREDAPLIANHPYDVSKSCADLLTNTYFHTYGLPVAITRCGNIYGPGDFNFSRLIPDAMRSLVINKTLMIRSDGTFVRDYVYVDDIITGYIKIAELMKKNSLSGEAFNLSNEKPITVIKLLKEINKLNLCGNELKHKIMNTAKYEIKGQYLSAAKAWRVLDWKPRYSLEKGLRKTTEWYAEYFNKQ
ncbi:MAG: GDP-mannose 4,6-dehydratase [Candidatus Omnitrophota bacterium]